MRVDVECGGTISSILDGEEFPGGLTKKQADTVLEAAAWCANQFLRRGGVTETAGALLLLLGNLLLVRPTLRNLITSHPSYETN